MVREKISKIKTEFKKKFNILSTITMFGKIDKPHTPKTKLKSKKKLWLVRLRLHRSKIKLNKNPKLSNVCLVK